MFFGGSMKSFMTYARSISGMCILAALVGCSNATDPAPKPQFFFVDTATGATTIDTAAYRAVLMTYGSLPSDDAEELSDMQEYAEAQEEVLAEIAGIPANRSDVPLKQFYANSDPALKSQEDAMQVVLGMFQLKEALPESSNGTFGDPEIDAAWDAAVGMDNKLDDKTEAVHAMFKMACFAIKEIREERASATSQVARFVADVQLAATENHLMSVMQFCAANEILFPQATDLPPEEVQEYKAKAAAKKFNFITPY